MSKRTPGQSKKKKKRATSKKMAPRTQRLRDPVHGLIVFSKDDRVDRLAWQLIDTPEFQRLRRIKQLGVSEFVFPGAVHSRFAHCIGVFNNARTLIKIIEREIHAIEKTFNPKRAEVAVIAALLHDIGHGPFSHVFEGVQKSRGESKHHETWTAEIIRNPKGQIKRKLEDFRAGFCDEVADLLQAEDPTDIYHAVVSSSFDADRLDYLMRDRLMTGTQAGAIDFDWLMEHLRVHEVRLDAAESSDDDEQDDGDGVSAPTFCLDEKALPAAEQFLLARYTLHEQVYFHKTTRCIESMIGQLLRQVANFAQGSKAASDATGLKNGHPLLRFYAKDGATLENYLLLDDAVVHGAIEAMTTANDAGIKELASRIRARRLFKTLDIRAFGSDIGKQRKAARKIDKEFAGKIGTSVIKDEGASLSIYTQIGGDDEKAYKKLRILDGARRPKEIIGVSPVIKVLADKKVYTRYYFSTESDREKARHLGKSI